jgi:hypothetical protein
MIDINYARSILNKPGLLMLYLWVHFINIGYYIITIECGHARKNIDWSICRPLSLFQNSTLHVPSQESERWYICVLGVPIWPLFLQFSIGFWLIDWLMFNGFWNCVDSVLCFVWHYIMEYSSSTIRYTTPHYWH